MVYWNIALSSDIGNVKMVSYSDDWQYPMNFIHFGTANGFALLNIGRKGI